MKTARLIIDSAVFIVIVALGFSFGTIQGILALLGCYLVARILEGKDER